MENFAVERSRVQIESSVMNLVDKSMLGAAFRPAGRFRKIAQAAGYEGLQWHPVRNIVAGVQMKAGLVGRKTKDAIRSASQSWRNEKTIQEAWNHPKRGLAMVSYLLLPERTKSLDDVNRLQEVVGHELPVVFQPSDSGNVAPVREREFGEKLVQPTAQLMEDWHVSTPQALVEKAKDLGYTGFALDLFLIRVPSKNGTKINWRESLSELLTFTNEVQVGAGRFDIPGAEAIDSQQELRDLLHGNGDSELIAMLLAVAGYEGRVVTEIPAASLRAIRKEDGGSWSVRALVADHTKIVNTIKNILT